MCYTLAYMINILYINVQVYINIASHFLLQIQVVSFVYLSIWQFWGLSPEHHACLANTTIDHTPSLSRLLLTPIDNEVVETSFFYIFKMEMSHPRHEISVSKICKYYLFCFFFSFDFLRQDLTLRALLRCSLIAQGDPKNLRTQKCSVHCMCARVCACVFSTAHTHRSADSLVFSFHHVGPGSGESQLCRWVPPRRLQD